MKLFKCYIIISVFALGSCAKFVNIDPPKNQLESKTVFLDSLSARGAINGLYVNIMETVGFLSGALSVYPSLSADELIPTNNSVDYTEFYQNQLSVDNSSNYGPLWKSAYKIIYSSNAIIEGITASEGVSPLAKEMMIAEARLVRGLCYFYLVNTYGGVPLVTSTKYKVNRILERSKEMDLYSFVEEDFIFARDHIQEKVVRNSFPSSFVAEALLSKVFLYQKKYDMAAQSATNVISSGHFLLEEELSDVFLVSNREAIWKLGAVGPFGDTRETTFFIPNRPGVIPNFIITSSLYNSFEPADKRKSAWIATNTIQEVDYHYPFKYKQRTPSGTEEYSIIRLAEIYLIRAEVNAKLNNFIEALADLNIVRARAGLSPVTSLNQNDILNAIEKERKVELFCEWGNRWFDLKRTGRATEVLSENKPEWRNSAEYYPIPMDEINSNPSLTQNEGY